MLSAKNQPGVGEGRAGGRGGNNERMTEKRRHSCVTQGPGPGPALTPLAILPTTYHGGNGQWPSQEVTMPLLSPRS